MTDLTTGNSKPRPFMGASSRLGDGQNSDRGFRRLQRPISVALSLVLLMTVVMSTANVAPAQAGLFDVFEMDGNAVDNPVTPQKDFETVYQDFVNGTTTSGANTFSFVQDPTGATETVFTGGGSKDINDITNWQWTNGSVPDKNELTNAYAATYLSPSGEPLFHLGVDRFANNGAASFGFWLLQEPIGLKSDGTFVNSETLAPAKHIKGDLLIVTNFGGGTPEVETFRWDAAAAGGPLIKVTGSSGVNDCASALATDSFCGVANSVTTPSPWPYTPKAGVPNVFPTDSYLEAVVNVQAALTSGLGCFNTLLAESRSSTLTTAQQKDLAIASGSACGVTVQKQGPPLSKEGDTARYTFTLRNTGVVPLRFSANSTDSNRIVDNVLGDITPQAIAQGCQSLAGGATCSFVVDWVVPAGYFTTRNPVINTVTARLAPPSGTVTSASTATATHRMELFSPGVGISTTISAGATVVAGTNYTKPGDVLTYTYTVTNSSLNGPTLSAPDLIFRDTVTPVDDGYVNDSILGALRTAAATAGCDRIAQGASCSFSANHTVAAANLVGEALTNTVSALYHPEGFPNRITGSNSHTALAQPDLVVSKDDGILSAAAGTAVTYSVTYQNVGHADAFAVVLSETVPVGTTFSAAGSPGWACADGAPAGTICTYPVGTILDGVAAVSVPFRVIVNPVLAAGLDATTNTVTIADNDARPDANPLNESGSHVTPLVAAPDLVATITDSAIGEIPGTIVTYTVTYDNVGTQDATGAALSVTIPADTTFNAGSSAPGWVCAPGTNAGSVCTLTIGSLPVAPGPVSALLSLDIASSATGSLATTVSISDDGTNGADLNNADNTATDTDTLIASTDLAITKSDNVDPVAAGSQLTYTLTVTNNGPSDATGVSVSDTLPVGLTVSSVSSSQGGCTTLPCALGAMPSGGTATVTVNVDVATTAVGTITNNASVSSATADPNGANNTASETTLVLNADLGVAKAVDDTTPPEGDTIVYTLTVTNAGPSTASGVVVSDVLPSGLTFVSSDGAYVAGTGEWTIGTLTSGSSVDLNITATVDAGTSGSGINNVATVSASSPADRDPSNNSANVTINVNVPPVAQPDLVTTPEDAAIVVDVLADNGSGPDADSDGTLILSSITVVTGPVSGTVVNNLDGTITYTPDLDFVGSDSFVYSVCDDDGECSQATVSISVSAVNDAPVARPNSYAIEEDTSASGNALTDETGAGVDSDVDTSDLLSVNPTPVTDVTNGSLILNTDGTFIYTPVPDFFGTDTFVYEVCDNGTPQLCDSATVTIVVDSNPDAVDDAFSMEEDATLLGSVADADAGDLPATYSVVGVAPVGLVFAADGTFSYTPPSDYFGATTFEYQVCDADGDCDTATATITVDASPDAVDDSASTYEDTAVSGTVLGNDDLGSEPTTVTSYDVASAAGGTVVMDAAGNYTYTPAADFFGIDAFTYTITDIDGDSSIATVSVTITPTPDAVDDAETTLEDTPLASNVIANDDLGSEPTTVTAYDLISGAGGVVVMSPAGSYTYTSAADFFGIDTFTYTITDVNGQTSTATVTITVGSAPDAVDDSNATEEDTAVFGSVLGNDDLGVEPTTVTAYDAGSVNGGAVVMDGAGNYTYTPPTDFNGVDTFTYTITDDNGNTSTATVTITVDANPDAVDDANSTLEDTPVSGGVLGNDDLGDEPTTVTAYDATSVNGGAVVMDAAGDYTYTPVTDYNGTDTFTYTITDVDGDTSTATVTVTVGSAPDAVDDSNATEEDTAVSGGVLTNDDLGVEPTTVTAYDVASVNGGTVVMDAAGNYTYTPAADFNGVDTFSYTITDANGNSSTATVTITVDANPDAVDDANSTLEDVAISGGVLGNDDLGDEPTTVTAYDATSVSGGTVLMDAAGNYTYTPAADFNGSDSFTYTITDVDGDTSTATVSVTVGAAPDAVDDSNATEEDTAVSGGVLTNDDLGVEPTTVTSFDAISVNGGAVVMDAAGNYTYTPAADFNGTDTFTYTITDDNGNTSTATVTITVDANPDAVDDANSTLEDTAVSGAVLGNDDLGDEPTTVTAYDAISVNGGAVVMDAAGNYTYTPASDFNGTDTFTYTITDADGDTSTATVSVTVGAAPDAVDDMDSTFEDFPVSGTVLNNDDLGVEPTLVSAFDATSANGGTVAMDAAGNYTYTPATDFNGTDTFGYTITDDNGNSSAATVTVTVVSAPDAVDDTNTTDEDSAVTGSVLGNDDLGSEPTTVTSYDTISASGGVVSMDAAGNYTYTPAADFFGIDTFDYTITDANGNTSTATVTITVGSTPDAVDDSNSTEEDTAVSGGVLANDDLGVEPTSVTAYDTTSVYGGSVAMNAAGNYTYTPAADFNGVDIFTYTITDDNGNMSTATVAITVDANPDAVDDANSTVEDTPVSGAVLGNDDLGDEPTTVTSYDATSLNGGTVVMDAAGNYTYSPASDFNGSDTFTYSITDVDGDTSTATVTVTVGAAPDAVDDSNTTEEDTAVAGSVLGNDDLGVEPTTVTSYDAASVNGGAVVMDAAGDYTYTPATDFNGADTFTYEITDDNGNTSTATVTITVDANPDAVDDFFATEEDTPVSGSVADLDEGDAPGSYSVVGAPPVGLSFNADGTFTYTPPADFFGVVAFDYQVCDVDGDCDGATATITVDANPDAVDDTNSTLEDTPVSGGVLGNDDLGDEPTTVTSYDATSVNGGTVVMDGAGNYTYTPATDFNGSDSFTYTITDVDGDTSTATVTITVGSAPDAVDDSNSTEEDTAVSGGVLSNDDLGVEPTTVTSYDVASVNGGTVVMDPAGNYTYTPATDFNGVDTFTYTITDDNGNTSTATVTITVDANPDAVDDVNSTLEDTAVSGAVLANDDLGDEPTTVTSYDVASVNGGTVVMDTAGSYTYTPAADFNGSDTFTYTITDADGDTSTATVMITIGSAPDAVDDANVTEEDTAVSGTVLGNDDLGVEPTTVTAYDVAGVNGGTVAMGAAGNYTYTPPADFNGTDTFTYTITDDNGNTSTATVTVTVDANPDAVDDANSTVEDTPVSGGVLGNDDLGDEPTTVTAYDATSVNGGSVVMDAAGDYTYSPAADFNGSDTFTYSITDADGDVSTATVTVTVDPVNDAPVANDDTDLTLQGAAVTTDVLANDTDIDSLLDPASVEVGDGINGLLEPINGSVAVNPDGSITYTPDVSSFGSDSYEYRVCDFGMPVLCDTATVVITIVANLAPVATDNTYAVDEDATVSGNVVTDDTGSGVDADADGTIDNTSATVVSNVTNGSLVLVGDGSFTYTPDPEFNGIDSFTYTVFDDDGAVSNEATVTITVNSVNDLPVAVDDTNLVDEDGGPVAGDVLVNDSGLGDGVASVTVVGLTPSGLTFNNDGTYSYTPPADFAGDVVVTYEVCDTDGDCAQATLTITVNPIADPPVAADDDASTDEDVPVTLDVTVDNGNGPDTDQDGDLDPASVSVGGVLAGPTNGSVVVNGDGTVTYTPNADFFGVDSFEYEICDLTALCDVAVVTVTVTAVNDAPVAEPDAAGTDAETPVSLDPLGDNGSGIDTDVDIADTLTVVSIDTTGTVGLVTLNGDGTVTYDPNGQFASLPAGTTATDTFTYLVCDDGAPVLCDSATVTITVTGVGDEPLAFDDAGTTLEDTPITIDVAVNDTDPDGDLDPNSAAFDTAPANGSVVFNGDGTVTYTPDANFFGTDSFTYVIYDLGGLFDTATVTITVDPVEDAPVALDDAAVTDEDLAVNIPVLINDSDPEGNLDPGTVTVGDGVNGLAEPANGSVVANLDGTVTYAPNTDFFGADSFEYQVCDTLGNCSVATVNVTVNSINDQPVASDDTETTPEDTPVIVDVQSNDTDPDLDPLTTGLVSAPANGSVVVNPDGTITYTPDTDFFGVDSFMYEVCDPGLPVLCDQATVTVTVTAVNDAPVAKDDSNTTDEDLPVVTDLVINDTDVEDGTVDAASVAIVSGPSNGTITAINPDGSVEYAPDADFFGVDTFTYTVLDSDGLISNTATVTITVNSINDGPLAQDDEVATAEDTPVAFDARLDNGNGLDTDPDGDPLSVASVTQGSNGSVAINGDGTITYTPNADFFGVDTFTYTVCDPGLPVLCDSATVTVTISPVNDAPVAQDDADSTEQGFAVVTDVAANDIDVEGALDLPSITIVTDPTNGTITAVNPDGTVEYTPAPGFVGTDTYEYSICDTAGLCDVALVTITITDNTPPVPADDEVATDEDTPVTFDPLLDNGNGLDSDPEGDPLTVASVTQPANGVVVLNPDGTITYTPAADFYGIDTFSYTICDDGVPSECATGTVTVTVDAVNDAPVAGDDLATTDEDVAVVVAVTVNDVDTEDGTVDPTSVTIVTAPTNGTITAVNPDGTVEYTPDANFSGTDTFEYQVCDLDGACDVALVTVTVNSINDAPVGGDDAVMTDEDTPVTFDGLVNDTDPDGDVLAVASVTQPANGVVVLNPDGTITYTPAADFNGTDTFTYTVCDPGGLCDLVTVTVTVDPVNDAPVVVNETPMTDEDTSINLDLIANDSDPDLDVITLDSVDATSANGGSIVVEPDGTVTYTPPLNFVGTDTFTYSVCDPFGACTPGLVELDVLPINDPPVGGPDSVVVDEDSTTIIDVLANDTDVDGDVLTVTSVDTTGTLGAVSINPDGTISYTPPVGYNGPDSFTYTMCDPGGLCDVATVDLVVTPLPDAPIAVDDSSSGNEDTQQVIDVLANDTDGDGDTLSVSSITQPSNGTTAVNPDGTVTYTPNPNFFGSDSFTYTVCDPSSLCDVATVSVVVLAVNDAPVAVDDSTTSGPAGTTIPVLSNDSDVDGDGLAVTAISVPANGVATANPDGTITYTPVAGFNGIDSFTYTVCDPSGACDTATVTVMVNGTGGLTGRVWLDMNYNGIINAGETNISGVRIFLDYAGADGVFGTVDDQLALAQTVTAGPYQFTGLLAGVYRVRVDVATLPAGLYWTYDLDGQFDSQARVVVAAGTTTAAVNFGYAIGNTAPVANDDGVITTPEDLSVTINVLANDADPDGQQLAVTSVTQPAHGTVIVNNDGTITYTPSAEYSGPDSFTYTVCEVTQTPLVGDPEGLCDSATVTLNVTFVNDAPYVDPTVLTVTIGATVPPLGVFDPEGDDYVVTMAGGALPPGVTLNPDGTFSGTPSRVGSYTFVVEVCDTLGACSTSVISIVVQLGAPSGGTLPLPDDTSTPPSTLPFTGLDSAWAAATAMLLMMGGVLLLLLTGKREPSPLRRRRN